AVGRFVEAERNLETLAKRQRESDEERARLETEVTALALYGSYSVEDIRRLERDHERLLAEFDASREALAARGYEAERVDLLTARFGALSEEEQELLRTQPQRALSFQT